MKQAESQAMETTRKELREVKTRLLNEEAKLAEGVHSAIDGAKEAAGSFSGDVKEGIETAVTDARLKSSELLGLTRETVKGAVRKAIDTGTNVEEAVVDITRHATATALQESRSTLERARTVSESVLSAAVESAEELGSHVAETASAAAREFGRA